MGCVEATAKGSLDVAVIVADGTPDFGSRLALGSGLCAVGLSAALGSVLGVLVGVAIGRESAGLVGLESVPGAGSSCWRRFESDWGLASRVLGRSGAAGARRSDAGASGDAGKDGAAVAAATVLTLEAGSGALLGAIAALAESELCLTIGSVFWFGLLALVLVVIAPVASAAPSRESAKAVDPLLRATSAPQSASRSQ